MIPDPVGFVREFARMVRPCSVEDGAFVRSYRYRALAAPRSAERPRLRFSRSREMFRVRTDLIGLLSSRLSSNSRLRLVMRFLD